MNEPRVSWGTDGFASESGWALAHCIDQVTGELLYSRDVWVSIGTSLPAGAFLDSPPLGESGKAIVRLDGKWSLVDDLRGITAYNKLNRQPEIISSLGPLSLELTLIPSCSPFDEWREELNDWVKNQQDEQDWLTQQAQQQRSSLLNEASVEISALSDAIDLGVISNSDEQIRMRLTQWKQYRAELAAIDCITHPIKWPAKPI
ncbi:MAG: tail fiber assembly protein [Plesiomonas sp.]|uniref:tail fiber assembly protein n=1 Tax=Plesiomonas sp. TaxID=2486279 RepID=UPI003F342FC7